MAVPVVADADTLFGSTTRGLLIHLDYQGLIRLHWSPLILDEMSRALVETGRKADRAATTRHETLMRATLPQAEVPTADVQSQFEAVAWAMRSAKAIVVNHPRRCVCPRPARPAPLPRHTGREPGHEEHQGLRRQKAGDARHRSATP